MTSIYRQLRFLITQAPGGPPPKYLAFRSSKWFIVAAMFMAVFTDLFLYAVVVPVIPFALEGRAGVRPGDTQHWVSILLAVYGAALFAGSPICGILADKTTSRRLPFLGGLIVLAGATVMLAIGSSLGVLIAGRILQGLSASMVWVVGLALLVDTVGKDAIAEATGYLTIAISLAILLAPLLGGIVYAKAGYYAVYGMCFGLLGVDIVLRVALVEKKVAAHWLGEDGSGAAEVEEGEGAAKTTAREPGVAGSEMNSHDPRDSRSMPPLQRTISRLLPRKLPVTLYLLTSSRMAAALLGTLVQATLLTAFDSVIPLYVRQIFHWDSIGAGLIFLPLVLASLLAPTVGWMTDKRGPRLFATVGFLFCCPFLVLLRFVDHDTLGQKALLCALLFLIGLGVMATLPPIMAEISYVILDIEQRKPPGFFGAQGAFARGYALFNMAYAAGSLIGPIWGGMIRQVAGWDTMVWTLGLLSGVASLPMVLFIGGKLWHTAVRKDDVERMEATNEVTDSDQKKDTPNTIDAR